MEREPGIGDVISFYGDKIKFVVEKIFVVEEPVFNGGGISEEPPNVWAYRHIWARELEILKREDNDVWKYNPKSMLVSFPTGGWSSKAIDPEDIELHGQMKMLFLVK